LPELLRLHPIDRAHLEAMTDEVGIMQHAIGSKPDPTHGYCTDDVARALQVDLLHQRELGWPAVADSAWRSVRFLTEAFDGHAGRFRNFRLIDGSWAAGAGSEDCHGRAMHALGDVIAAAPETALVDTAAALFERALPATNALSALRAIASVALACDAAIDGGLRGPAILTFRLMADRLEGAFEPRSASNWRWPEPRLTYENGLAVRALIVAGERHGVPRMIDAGLSVFDWLVAAQIALDGHLSPVGNEWWTCGGPRSRFDQQPIEATSLLLTAESAYVATGDPRYRTVMERAYGWFLGENDLGVHVADPDRGASYDGLTSGGVNQNQGAESTLMWLIALEHVRAIRRTGQPTATPAGIRAAGAVA
jgi:hypothetical protein